MLKNYGTDEVPLFKARDIGDFLEIKDVNSSLRNNKYKVLKINTNGHQQIFITEQGVKELICNSRKPKSIELCKLFNIDINSIKIIHKESDFLNNIYTVFNGENIIDQYYVDGYKIDIYFIDYKLAIEFDEKYHKNKNEQDTIRQINIEKKLNCNFLRFNENENIFKCINVIYNFIKNSKANIII